MSHHSDKYESRCFLVRYIKDTISVPTFPQTFQDVSINCLTVIYEDPLVPLFFRGLNKHRNLL